MKYADAKKLPEMTEQQLADKLEELLKDQFSFRMQKGLGQLGQTHVVRETRRDIARVKTSLSKKHLQGAKG